MSDGVQSDQSVAVSIEMMRSQQNLAAGSLAGLVAALAGAGVWAVVTAVTEYQIGWMAIGVGFIVGLAVRTVGKGIEPVFGIVGAVLSLAGCLLGNYLTIVWFIAADEGVAFMEVLGSLGIAAVVEIMTIAFDPMDLFFYAIAIYFGFRYSFVQIVAPAPDSA